MKIAEVEERITNMRECAQPANIPLKHDTTELGMEHAYLDVISIFYEYKTKGAILMYLSRKQNIEQENYGGSVYWDGYKLTSDYLALYVATYLED